MSNRWEEFGSRAWAFQRDGDSERQALPSLYHAGFACHETDPERSFALFTQARNEAQRLNEPWWVLFFDAWRLTALTSYLMDFTRALPLAMDLMVRFQAPDAQFHPERIIVLDNVLYTYTNIDPFGYEDELERGFAHMDGQIHQGPVSERFVLHYRWMYYLHATDRDDAAYDLAHRSLALVDRSRDALTQVWHGSWALYQLCRSCHALARFEELAGHADRLAELSARNGQLRRTEADAWLWRAYLQRRKGHEREAFDAFLRGRRLLDALARQDSICADPAAAYHEAAGDLMAAVDIRDREFAAVSRNGMLHRACQVQVERCRLLATAGRLTAEDLSAARGAAGRLRSPERFLDRLDRIAAAASGSDSST